MKITGELLRSERMKRDLKISDVGFALKLGNKIIQALEDGDAESLPAKTFVRGFVKSYAEFLKLDSAIVLRQFQEEMGSTNPVPKLPPPQPVQSLAGVAERKKPVAEKKSHPVDEKTNVGLTQRHLLVFFSVAIFVGALASVNYFIDKYSKERADIAIASVTRSAESASGASFAEQQQVNLSMMSQTVPLSNDLSAVTEKAAALNITKNESISASEKTVDFPTIQKSNGKPVEVLIEAKKNVVIQYAKGDSSVFEKIAIKENSYQIIRSQSGLHLRSEDGASIGLTVNGVALPQTKSKPFQISF